MQELIDKIQELVAFELNRANTIHPPKFNSYHEAYAVILEEYEEMTAEVEKLKCHMGGLWNSIKADADERTHSWLEIMEKRAILAAAEAIQIAAVCRKAGKVSDDR